MRHTSSHETLHNLCLIRIRMIQRKDIKVEGVRTKTATADLLRNIRSVVLYVCVHLCVENTLILNGWIFNGVLDASDYAGGDEYKLIVRLLIALKGEKMDAIAFTAMAFVVVTSSTLLMIFGASSICSRKA